MHQSFLKCWKTEELSSCQVSSFMIVVNMVLTVNAKKNIATILCLCGRHSRPYLMLLYHQCQVLSCTCVSKVKDAKCLQVDFKSIKAIMDGFSGADVTSLCLKNRIRVRVKVQHRFIQVSNCYSHTHTKYPTQ